MRTPLCFVTACSAVVAVASVGVSPAMAQVPERVKELNALADATGQTVRAEDTLFPVLAEMDEPPMPASLGAEMDALLLVGPNSAQWGSMSRWARRQAQQDVIEVLKELATGDLPPVLGIAYGADSSELEWVDAGLYVELGKGQMIAGMTPHYLERIEWAAALGMFEAMRLAAEGDGEGSLAAVSAVNRLGRMLVERPTDEETLAALAIMRLASERARDVMYSFPDAFESDELQDYAREFDMRTLRLRQAAMPMGGKLAAMQMLERAFERRAGVDRGEFARMLATIQSGERPLRRLSEAAQWQAVADAQGDWFDQLDMIEAVWSDFNKRWIVPGYQDRLLQTVPVVERLDASTRTLVHLASDRARDLLNTRTSLEVDLAGTVMSLGMEAYRRDNRTLPLVISAIEPNYVTRTLKDPYHFARDYALTTFYDFEYLVPIRDQQWDRREDPQGYDVQVMLPEEGASMFAASSGGGGSADAVLKQLSLNSPAVKRLIGRPAPEIALTNWHNSEPLKLADLKGDIVVSIHWATWCGPCKASIPSNNSVYNTYKNRGLTMIGVCNDRGGNTMARTADQHDMAYPTGLDNTGETEKAYKVPHFPYSVIIDRKGVVRAAGVRPNDLDKAVAALMAEQPTAESVAGDEFAAMGAGMPEMGGGMSGMGDMSGMGGDMGAMGGGMGGMDPTMLAGGLGGMDVPAEMQARLMGAVDFENFTADVRELRSVLREMAEMQPATAEAVASVEQMLGDFNAWGLTADNPAQQVRAMMSGQMQGGSAQQAAQMGMMAQMFGIDMGALTDLVATMAERAMDVPMVTDLMQRVEGGGSVTTAQVDELELALIEALVVDDVVDPAMAMLKNLTESMANMQGMGGMAAGGESFTATIGDPGDSSYNRHDQWVMYSVGPDGMDNEARKVGVGGDDILLWPPVMSLHREHVESGGF
jgi:peroxiredoxin